MRAAATPSQPQAADAGADRREVPIRCIRELVTDAAGLFSGPGQNLPLETSTAFGSHGLLEMLSCLVTSRPWTGRDRTARPADRHQPFLQRALLAQVDAWSDELNERQLPLLRRLPWPGNRPLAVLLSHDIDQIHDRELFRVLADINHLRRMFSQGESGRVGACLQRIARALLRPKDAVDDFAHLLGIEAQHGIRSSFLILHDDYWSRHGSRYRLADAALERIVRRVVAARGEIGVHGSYYRYNDVGSLRRTREELQARFGVTPVGVRNHYLRFENERTWRAQQAAGFRWDSTLGDNARPGPKLGLCLPYHPCDPEDGRMFEMLELPLTLMDTSLFRWSALGEERALTVAMDVLNDTADVGGLVVALWHNNFFNEPEYREWEAVYRAFLAAIVRAKAWVATGAEIDAWWRARGGVQLVQEDINQRTWKGTIQTDGDISDLALEVRLPQAETSLRIDGSHTLSRSGRRVQVVLPRLAAGERISITVGREG